MEFKQQQIARKLKNIAGQKFTWCVLSLAALSFTAFSTKPEESTSSAATSAPISPELLAGLPPSIFTSNTPFEAFAAGNPGDADGNKLGSQLVAYAKSLLGKPYTWGSASIKKGFDCSGFVYHIFSKFDFTMERSSRAQSTQGTKVDIREAKPGDLLFFTGTNPKIRSVGHVGIVISKPGEPVSFVHSSSNGGVKISELEGYYNTRFMFAKRVD